MYISKGHTKSDRKWPDRKKISFLLYVHKVQVISDLTGNDPMTFFPVFLLGVYITKIKDLEKNHVV